eukprot:COSAG03_NODE_10409_length_652_cov_24.177215_1_plen_48_part_10
MIARSSALGARVAHYSIEESCWLACRRRAAMTTTKSGATSYRSLTLGL